MKVERQVDVAAPPDRLYEVVMDPLRLADWVTIHDHLVGDPPRRLEKGSRLTQCLRLAGRRFKVRWTVVENDPCRRVVWEGRGPVASHAKVEYRFEANGDGTRFSYLNQFDLPGGPLGRLAGRTVARATTKAVDGSLRRLRTLVE
ncbi:MAG TPA: SRPBCC family protein [Thermoleophilaceae bacterium]|nr:SRPBCC family protein [Thermoleophilaceae bacterium]